MALEREVETYRRKLPELLPEKGKYVLIFGDEVEGIFESSDAAIEAGYGRHLDEAFLVRQIAEKRASDVHRKEPPTMPYATISLNEHGAVIELLVGVAESRRTILERNGLPVPHRVRVLAQIDTGAPFCTFAPFVFEQLEIKPVGIVDMRTPSTGEGTCPFEQYVVSLSLSGGGIELHLSTREVVKAVFAADEGIHGLLGRDLLEHCLFIYDGQQRTFSLAF